MKSWGDINVALNRLVREGVILTFKTNMGAYEADAALHVTVTPPEGAAAEEVRRAVEQKLNLPAGSATVTVDGATT